MARTATIPRERLKELLDEGVSPSECARILKYSRSGISRAIKRLKGMSTRVAVMETARECVDKHLDTIEQLAKINAYANELLDLLMRWNRGEEEALQILESQVHLVRVGQEEPEWVKEFKFKDPRELALKAMAEIRNQLRLQLEIFQTLYDVKAVEEFQKEVLEAIGAASPDVRERIISSLTKRRAIRASIQFPQ